MLSRNEKYAVETSEGTFSGTYVSRETGGTEQGGYDFYYLDNDSAEYRITLVVGDVDNNYFVDVNATDGSHETMALMAEFESIEQA